MHAFPTDILPLINNSYVTFDFASIRKLPVRFALLYTLRHAYHALPEALLKSLSPQLKEQRLYLSPKHSCENTAPRLLINSSHAADTCNDSIHIPRDGREREKESERVNWVSLSLSPVEEARKSYASGRRIRVETQASR